MLSWILFTALTGCDPCGDPGTEDSCPGAGQDSATVSDTAPGIAPLPLPAPSPVSTGLCMGSPQGPGVRAFDGIADDSLVTRADLDLTLGLPANAVLTCTHADDPTEVHRLESLVPALAHRWTVHGLLADSDYTCQAVATCTEGGSDAATTTLSTGSLPTDLAAGTVTTAEGHAMTGAYTLYNHKGFCDGEQAHRLVMVDPEGRVRWYWEGLDSDFGVGVAASYLGEDVVISAGGTGENAGPRLSNLDGEVLYETPSDWGVVFHHYAEQLSDGHLLSVTEATDSLGGPSWKGTRILEHDPDTDTIVRSWASQQALDAGEGGIWDVGTTGADLNVNWASRDDAGDWYLSLCGAQRIAKVDPDSGAVLWVIGPGEGFTLLDDAGAALPSDDWPQCQHGVEVVQPDRLLVYDNGRDRLEARAAEFVVDLDARIVTRTWVWTEPEFYERAWGDIDRLSEDRVLLGIGHCRCCTPASENVTRILEVDRPTATVVWRYELPADDSVLYQVDRIDGCDVFDNVRYCPALGDAE